MSIEIWREIPGASGYEASSNGRIRSIKGAIPRLTGRVLRHNIVGAGYHRVHVATNGAKRNLVYVHRLVAMAFIGAPRNEEQVNHKNGIKSDNCPSNLEYVTRSQNIKHAIVLLGGSLGDRRKVPRKMHGNIASECMTETQASVAMRYGISQTRVSQIIRGK